MKRPAALAAFLVAAAGAAGAEGLPLQPGFYVTVDTACGAASAATLTLVQRDGIGGARDFCAFQAVVPEGPGAWRVTESCADLQDPANAEVDEALYEMIDGGYRRTSAFGWVTETRHCDQQSLPEPWRSNDISDILR